MCFFAYQKSKITIATTSKVTWNSENKQYRINLQIILNILSINKKNAMKNCFS